MDEATLLAHPAALRAREQLGSATGSTEEWRPQLWLCLGLALLILIPYANSFSAGLLFDSDSLIRQDSRLRGLNSANIEQIFTHNYWWPSQESDLYRPLTTLSYLFNYTVLGNHENVFGYHAVNFLLHWLNACLVLLIVRRLAARWDVAALTASLFAVHPVNTEAVTNVAGRADLLATFCVLFGGWCYLRALDSRERKNTWLAIMGVVACLGVLAKENAVMIVAFIALFDFLWRWPLLSANDWRGKLKAALEELGVKGYAALIPALTLLWLIRRWVIRSTPVFGQQFVDNPLVGAAPFQGFMTAMSVIGRYLKLLVYPRTLSGDYSFNQIPLYGTPGNSAGLVIALFSIATVALLLTAAVWLRRGQKFFCWSVLFLLVMMLPTSNLFLTIGSIMAERFLYLPSIGFCAMAAVAFCAAGEMLGSYAAFKPRVMSIVYWTLPAVAISLLGVRTFLRNADWHDDLGFWKSTVAASPSSFKAHMLYGHAIWAEAQQTRRKPLEQAIDEALAEAETARSIVEPEPPLPLASQNNTIYIDLGNYYRVKGEFLDGNGRHDEAKQLYQKSLVALVKARALDRFANDASRQFRLRIGVPAEEIADVGNYTVYGLLGLTYAKLEQWENCEMAGRYLQHIVPDEPSGYTLVGGARYNLGRPADAAVQYIAGLLIDPGNSQMWTNLSTTYSGLEVQPNPVMQEGTRMVLNPQIPLVRQHLNQAAVTVVRLFKEAKKISRAHELQDQFMKQYSVPPELF
jgi:tetratricopeptide (TPR) repeat protein